VLPAPPACPGSGEWHDGGSLNSDDAMAAATSTQHLYTAMTPWLRRPQRRQSSRCWTGPGFGSAPGSSSLAAAGVLAAFYASLLVLSLVNRGGGEGEALEAVFLALHCAAHLAAAAVVAHEKRARAGTGH
jgi:hypothetical protein